MDNYNPRQNTRMRWKDAKELEKFKFIADEFNFDEEVLEQASQHEPWCKIVNTIENGTAYKPILIFDELDNSLYFGSQENDTLYLQSLYATQGYIVEIKYTKSTDKLTITITEENYLSEDNLKTIFGQTITGTGNITMYRHQITIRFDTDTKEAHYVVYSSNKSQITNYDDFIEVAKPISNFNYTAVYVNDNNAEPAFIRFASGTILVGLSTGIEPYTSVSDDVSTL